MEQSTQALSSWAGAQPVWLQIVIGLTVFFVVLPLCLYVAAQVITALLRIPQAMRDSSEEGRKAMSGRHRQRAEAIKSAEPGKAADYALMIAIAIAIGSLIATHFFS